MVYLFGVVFLARCAIPIRSGHMWWPTIGAGGTHTLGVMHAAEGGIRLTRGFVCLDGEI